MSERTEKPVTTGGMCIMCRAIPVAWMRPIRSPGTPNGPAEYDVDFSYGDDKPEGDGWLPLYRP